MNVVVERYTLRRCSGEMFVSWWKCGTVYLCELAALLWILAIVITSSNSTIRKDRNEEGITTRSTVSSDQYSSRILLLLYVMKAI